MENIAIVIIFALFLEMKMKLVNYESDNFEI